MRQELDSCRISCVRPIFPMAESKERVVITGLGVLTPLGNDLETFWANLKNGVSGEELLRVKAQVMAGEVFKLDSLFYQAMQIGQLESIGLGHQAIPVMLEKLQAVTAEQVQQVAGEFLQDDNLTVATLAPQPLSGKPKHKQGGSSHVR